MVKKPVSMVAEFIGRFDCEPAIVYGFVVGVTMTLCWSILCWSIYQLVIMFSYPGCAIGMG